ncbi:ATP-binding protein [Ruminococcus sp. OA3]|uniref:ATP-binding protein n=1 Tax=Ruminococcus sp. OA3 TaxID=2914164 RepID=UPI001F070270|nr:ATP-binding protein [Ruminococcus sp. OA3]MCH1983496.1 ATP-binding protein [Ruminococcus sp. OA3]
MKKQIWLRGGVLLTDIFPDRMYTNPKQFLVITGAVALSLILAVLFLLFYLANRKMNQKLKNALTAKNDFLSRMSHDMRTPLNAIIGLSRMGLDSKSRQERQDCLQKINHSGSYLLGLINNTLDMSKMGNNKMKLILEPWGTDEFLQSICDLIGPVAQEKGVGFTLEKSPMDNYILMVDKLRIQQVVINMLTNAVKFTPSGGWVHMCAETLDEYEGQREYRITIQDNGIGMSQEFQRRMFEPFEQEDASKTSGDSGTGLGLAIVKQLVELMEGTITCSSDRGKGTTFIVSMKAREVKAEENGQKDDNHLILQGKRILIAEDHPLNMEIASYILSQQGILTEPAENGRIAVDLFEKSPEGYYDAILMDLRMPVLDGLEAAKKIRESRRQDAVTIPIIAMTANVFDEDKEKSQKSGMNVHLAKPINPQELYQVLTDLISAHMYH